MTELSTLKKESQILKSGSNEFKLIEFNVGGMRQGINLLKVKKLIEFRAQSITSVFDAPKAVLGMLEIDGQIISIIDMRVVYGVAPSEANARDDFQKTIIITEFNQRQYGFIVDSINMVHRLSWKELQPVDRTCPSDLFVAIATVPTGDVLLVDFEMIIDKLYPKSTKMPPEISNEDLMIVQRRKNARLICCDDSKIIRKKLDHVFKKHNFLNVTICNNGLEAYNEIEKQNTSTAKDQYYTFMITDIEMPQMDGLSLCLKVKEKFPEIPVLILSSLVSDQLMQKCREVNADNAISKNRMQDLVNVIDELLGKQEKLKKERKSDSAALAFT